MGIADDGNAMELSPDPLLDELKKYVANIKLSTTEQLGDTLKPILMNEEIFGVDLYFIGLGEKIEGYFNEMISGTGAVRATLEKYLECR